MENVKIEFTRGDTFKRTLKLYNGNEEYTPDEGDVIRFAAKKSYGDNHIDIEKIVPTDTMLFELEPADTKTLKYGSYVFEFELTTAEGEVYTFMKGRMVLTPEV